MTILSLLFLELFSSTLYLEYAPLKRLWKCSTYTLDIAYEPATQIVSITSLDHYSPNHIFIVYQTAKFIETAENSDTAWPGA